ncbi:MAG: phosphotransferase, partial [Nitrospinales bacterium]
IGTYHDKPFIIFEFVEGQFIEFPNEAHWIQLIKMAAELQNLTLDFQSDFTKYRWNYSPALCSDLANKQAREIKNKDAYDKLKWLENELLTLNLPTSIPKGICHCDFHYSNMLFRDDELVTVLDFDDANFTFLQFDLVGLIEYQAWPNDQDNINYLKAHEVLQEYMKHRPLLHIEQIHLYDVYKLSILLDCVWYFNRGNYSDFREKRKIEALNCLGRNKFYRKLFKD